MEQIHQVMRACFAFHLYVKNESRIAEQSIFYSFPDNSVRVTNVNGGIICAAGSGEQRYRTALVLRSVAPLMSFEALLFCIRCFPSMKQ